jgi:glucans biosynthesis protein
LTATLDRRRLLQALGLAGAWAAGSGAWAASPEREVELGPPQAFSFQRLQARARRRSKQRYVAPTHPAVVDQIGYAAWGQVRFDTRHALFRDGPLPVTFFHVGRFFPDPVRMYAVEGGVAREVVYEASYFDIPPGNPAGRAQAAGFAGFRVQEPRAGALDWRTHDWVAFLGASYFRAIGALHQYGLSARAVSLDTAVYGRPEEFPRFTEVFIEKPPAGARTITVCALLEGPSIAGACRFRMTRGEGVVMDVDQSLFLRRPVSRFGVAPLTSMYWFSETQKATASDWRPEIHDSDGLELWTGAGERIWRPLNNPREVAVSAFLDDNPRGFGLMQRDRTFDHYMDGVFYDRRPSLWVEPKGSWGRGSVQLVEIPTGDETNDNIVAMWTPERPPAPHARFDLSYRLHWLADNPFPSGLARCVATRLGPGGQEGLARPAGVRKFVVEFLGGPLAQLPYGVAPEMQIHASRGRVTDYRRVEAVPDNMPGHWRVEFDLADVPGGEPVELRLQLTVGGKAVSEVWSYQYRPA